MIHDRILKQMDESKNDTMTQRFPLDGDCLDILPKIVEDHKNIIGKLEELSNKLAVPAAEYVPAMADAILFINKTIKELKETTK